MREREGGVGERKGDREGEMGSQGDSHKGHEDASSAGLNRTKLGAVDSARLCALLTNRHSSSLKGVRPDSSLPAGSSAPVSAPPLRTPVAERAGGRLGTVLELSD